MNNKCSIFINEVEVQYDPDGDTPFEIFLSGDQDPGKFIFDTVMCGKFKTSDKVILEFVNTGRFDIIFALAAAKINDAIGEMI